MLLLFPARPKGFIGSEDEAEQRKKGVFWVVEFEEGEVSPGIWFVSQIQLSQSHCRGGSQHKAVTASFKSGPRGFRR